MLTVGLRERSEHTVFCFLSQFSVTLLAVTYLSKQQVEGVICWSRPDYQILLKSERVQVWSASVSFGDASHYISVIVLMSLACLRSSGRRISATFCLRDTIGPFLPWYFHNVFLQGPRVHRRLLSADGIGCGSPLTPNPLKVFARISEAVCLHSLDVSICL